MKCQCENPGFCPLFNRVMKGRPYELCNEDSELGEKYRQKYLKEAEAKKMNAAEPTLKDKIYSFAHALAKYVASGFTNVKTEEYEARLKICETCEHNKGGVCELCGCNLSIKAQWATEECPMGKWPKISLPVLTSTTGCGGCRK